MRLFPKLVLSFLAVIVAGVVTVSIMANQAADREVRAFMVQGGMTSQSALAQELAGYYRGRGSWAGVASVFPAGDGMNGMMNQQLLLADANGQIVADTTALRLGQTLTEAEIAQGQGILVDGRQAGTLIAQGGMAMGGDGAATAGESDLTMRVNRAVWLAAAAAAAVALVVGSLLAYSLVRPVQQLIQATAAVARGDLSRRVAADSKDEIGELAASFNMMADNLQQATRQRQAMTADIAHELRNPLAVLQSNLEAVLDGVLPQTPDTLQPLLEQTHLLARLVDDLRTLALAEAGQLELKRAAVDANALARSVAARFAPLAEAKSIVLSVQTDPSELSLNIDSQRIEQVLGNLLGNALRYTSAGGRVVCRVAGPALSSDSAKPGAVFTVSDSGPGIPAEALPHIFERFYRVDHSRSRADGGTGLGLAIARQLVELHGGRIWAASQVNLGTEVVFTLPLTSA
jgi:signal transduction histidine kinase